MGGDLFQVAFCAKQRHTSLSRQILPLVCFFALFLAAPSASPSTVQENGASAWEFGLGNEWMGSEGVRRARRRDIETSDLSRSILDIPHRLWRERVGVSTGVPILRLESDEACDALMTASKALFQLPRVRTDWCMPHREVEFLGGEVAVAQESFLQQAALEKGLAETVQLLLPGTFGWSIPRASNMDRDHLYHRAAKGDLRISELRAFELEEAREVVGSGAIEAEDVEVLLRQGPGIREMVLVAMRIRSTTSGRQLVTIPRGTVLEVPSWAACASLVVARPGGMQLQPKESRCAILICMCLRPLPRPRGRVNVTPFSLQVPMHGLKNPLENHLTLWRFLGERQAISKTLYHQLLHDIGASFLIGGWSIPGYHPKGSVRVDLILGSDADKLGVEWNWRDVWLPRTGPDGWERGWRDLNRKESVRGCQVGEPLELSVPVRGQHGRGYKFPNRFALALADPSLVTSGKYYTPPEEMAFETPLSVPEEDSSAIRADALEAGKVAQEGVYDSMRELLHDVDIQADALVFRLPVTEDEAPNYHQIIAKPISLLEIRRKTFKRQYSSAKAFLADFDLMFQNAFTYNAGGSPVCICALRLQEFVARKAKELRLDREEQDNGGRANRVLAEAARHAGPAEGTAQLPQSNRTHVRRKIPNLLICGTPGTGKSTLAASVAAVVPVARLFNIGQLVKEHGIAGDRDEARDCWVLGEEEENAVLDLLEPEMAKGGCVLEHHSCGLFPERWFDRVVVLRADNSVLHPRLTARAYPESKIAENIECEIMEVVIEEARESYAKEVVVELRSETEQDMASNVQSIAAFFSSWSASPPQPTSTAAAATLEQPRGSSPAPMTNAPQPEDATPVRRSTRRLRGDAEMETEEAQHAAAEVEEAQEEQDVSLARAATAGVVDDAGAWNQTIGPIEFEALTALWTTLNTHPDSLIFRPPITVRDAPDYRLIVPKPTCLQQIKRKLDRAHYRAIGEVVDELDLVFRNAFLYNLEGSPICLLAQKLQALLRQDAAAMLERIFARVIALPLPPLGAATEALPLPAASTAPQASAVPAGSTLRRGGGGGRVKRRKTTRVSTQAVLGAPK